LWLRLKEEELAEPDFEDLQNSDSPQISERPSNHFESEEILLNSRTQTNSPKHSQLGSLCFTLSLTLSVTSIKEVQSSKSFRLGAAASAMTRKLAHCPVFLSLIQIQYLTN
jgi:hypothetical protein